jgi:hypothetical protein
VCGYPIPICRAEVCAAPDCDAMLRRPERGAAERWCLEVIHLDLLSPLLSSGRSCRERRPPRLAGISLRGLAWSALAARHRPYNPRSASSSPHAIRVAELVFVERSPRTAFLQWDPLATGFTANSTRAPFQLCVHDRVCGVWARGNIVPIPARAALWPIYPSGVTRLGDSRSTLLPVGA